MHRILHALATERFATLEAAAVRSASVTTGTCRSGGTMRRRSPTPRAWQEDIETRSARMVRESFAGAADREKLVELGKLLARRRALVRRWRDELAAQ